MHEPTTPPLVACLRLIESDAFEAMQYVDAVRALCCADDNQATLKSEQIDALLKPVHGHLSSLMAAFDQAMPQAFEEAQQQARAEARRHDDPPPAFEESRPYRDPPDEPVAMGARA